MFEECPGCKLIAVPEKEYNELKTRADSSAELLDALEAIEAHIQVPQHLRGKPELHAKEGLKIREQARALLAKHGRGAA